MATERLDGYIKTIESKKEVPHHRDGQVMALSKHLLYDNPGIEAEVAGYTFLRGLLDPSDRRLVDPVRKALDARWQKVGFYYAHEIDYFSAFNDDDKESRRMGFFESRQSEHNLTNVDGIGPQDRVAILRLARQFEDPQALPISVDQIGDMLRPLLGVSINPEELVAKLKSQHLLTDAGEFIPLLTDTNGLISISSEATGILLPHLPVLEAISYPEVQLDEEGVRKSQETRDSIVNSYNMLEGLYEQDASQELLLNEGTAFYGDEFFLLQAYFDAMKNGSFEKNQIIAFLNEAGQAYRLSRDKKRKNVSISVFDQPVGAKRSLMFDHWGQQLLGEQRGKLTVNADTFMGPYVEVSGVLVPELPEGMGNASRVYIGDDGTKISWDDESWALRGIQPELVYGKNAQAEKQTLDSLLHLRISGSDATVQKLKEPKKDLSMTWDFVDIDFQDQEGLRRVRLPNGKTITVTYARQEDSVVISFEGRGWKNSLTVPSKIETSVIAKKIESSISSFADQVIENEDTIKAQVKSARSLSMSEEIALRAPRVDERESDLLDFKLKKEARDDFISVLDEEFAKLDAESQWVVKAYSRVVLAFKLKRRKGEELESDQDTLEDLKSKVRFFIRKNNLNIPTDLLEFFESS